MPVFDSTGNIALALTSLGPTGLFDVAWDGSIARPLLACAQEISRSWAIAADLPATSKSEHEPNKANKSRKERQGLSQV